MLVEVDEAHCGSWLALMHTQLEDMMASVGAYLATEQLVDQLELPEGLSAKTTCPSRMIVIRPEGHEHLNIASIPQATACACWRQHSGRPC